MTGEGYLLLATGPAKYVAMARNLAASLKVMDRSRRICLVHDENAVVEPSDRRLFDDFAVLREDPRYAHTLNKLRVYSASPYDRTMFVDVDCLLVKRDIDVYWDMARPFPFGITGARRVDGEWKGVDVARLLKQEGAPYLVQMNSGVFCFDKSPESARFYDGLNDFYLRRRHELGIALSRGKPGQTDELYIGLWMGLNGLDSCGGRVRENSWMVSTWRGFGMKFDPERSVSVIRKPRRSIAGVPNPLGGWDRISPSFVHFIGLKPESLYTRLAAHFHAALGHRGV